MKLKQLSNLYLCNCGHNDFNFVRCTLEQIGKFLNKLYISVHSGRAQRLCVAVQEAHSSQWQ